MASIHLALDVQSLADSLEFYSALLGAEPVELSPDHARFHPALPEFRLVLREKTHCCIQGVDYVGLQLSAEGMQSAKARLSSAGYWMVEIEDCCDQPGFRVTDPSGHRWRVCASSFCASDVGIGSEQSV